MEKVTEAFADTGEVIEREPTEQELIQSELDSKSYAEAKAAEATALAAKEAILAKIGLTTDELALLLS
jgi:hypothetical protein